MRLPMSLLFGFVGLICFDLIFTHYAKAQGNEAYLGGAIAAYLVGCAYGKYMGGGWDE